ncbi:hypothetical protein FRC03_012239 [Tulasnella sp. 419]|nr:hypothetical protein FRC03_012239 [Tulasnella sp. 419]
MTDKNRYSQAGQPPMQEAYGMHYGSSTLTTMRTTSGYYPDPPAPAYQHGGQPSFNGPGPMAGYPPPNGYGYHPGYPPPGPQYYPQPQPAVQTVVVQQTSQNNNDSGAAAGGVLAW